MIVNCRGEVSFSEEVTVPKVGEGQECGGTTVRIIRVDDLPSSTFAWTIRNFSRLSIKKHYFEVFSNTQHTFNAQESDWGFTSFPLNKLCDPSRGFLVGDTLIVGADVDVTKVVEGTVVIQQNKEGVPEAGPSKSATQQGRLSSCAICLDAPIEGACIPCGHMPGCMSCLSNIEVNSWGCPICRAKIQKVVRIYTV
ncbi:hypothetical protein IFM89_011829 [Coptis chinensis]|uniref:RING-type domain-containing protein n=1 Tax=Coptis chinensis TaxID=261450 RepID=A0A835H329_9MAGN|nr:hypothetical protein IFM89_011829 [Coptis chinensis]